MSEYQFIDFRAIDRPVTGKNLEYMEQQSSHAEIDGWSFTNEYHYGAFRGNVLEMMRRGYDIHLHYANFGIRRLLIRLPNGFPDQAAARRYLSKDESLRFIKDKSGRGGCLEISPSYEALDQLWDLDGRLDQLVPLREEIINGDLRPLYLAHLLVSADDSRDPEETVEGPVPAGLEQPTDAQRAMFDFFEVDGAIITAAARGGPKFLTGETSRPDYVEWLRAQPQVAKDGWLAELMANAKSTMRMDLLNRYRRERDLPSWPTVERGWTIQKLLDEADKVREELKRKEAAAQARARTQTLARMAKDPQPFLTRIEELVATRSSESYRDACRLLSDLREALAGTERAGLAEQQAWRIHEAHATLHKLTAALRKAGFVPKK